MKKSNKRKPPNRAKRKPTTPHAPVKADRHAFLSRVGTIAGTAILLGGLGFWGISAVQASVAERDLTQVGTGTPTIVQVHDAQCSTCVVLQGAVRTALKEFDKATLDYRVADLKTDDGLSFATRHGATYTTLLFFDGDGNLNRRMVGVNDSTTLVRAFTSLVGRE